jgi:hypothetical protein
VDGKFLKGSYDNLIDTDAMNLISVFLAEKGLILAHLGVENKESEMVGVRDLLKTRGIGKRPKIDRRRNNHNGRFTLSKVRSGTWVSQVKASPRQKH